MEVFLHSSGMIFLPMLVRFLAVVVVLLPVSLLAAFSPNPVTNLPAYTFTTIAGTVGVSGSADGSGTNATFNNPTSVAVDSNGVLYVTDTGNNTIRQIDTNGNVTTLAGSAGTNGYNDAQGTNALFSSPEGLSIDANGLLYVADASNNVIRRIFTDGTVTTWAGIPFNAFSSSYPPSVLANYHLTSNTPIQTGNYPGNFGIPFGLCFNTNGLLYVTQVDGGTLSTVNSDAYISLNTYYSQAIFLTGLTFDNHGTLVFVSNGGNSASNSFIGQFITGKIVPVVGTDSVRGNADGLGTNARFNQPTGIGSDQYGDLFVSDSGNNSIRMIPPDGSNNLTTLSLADGLASNAPNTPGSSDGIGTNASFNAPQGVAVTPSGVIYIADTANNTIRKGTPPPPSQRLSQTLLSSTKLPATGKVGVPLIYKATYSSGLPPVLSSSASNVVTVSGSTVTPCGVGTVTITAAQPGNVFYASLPSVVMKLVVGKGPQSITFSPVTNTLTVGGYMVQVPCYSSTGLPVTLTSSDTNVITCSASSGYYANFTIVGAGLATITATLPGATNYLAATPVHQVLKVGKALQTIYFTLGSGTISKGTKVGLSATVYSSNLSAKFTSSNPRVISISGTNATAIGAGTATIIASQPGNKNYRPAIPVTNSVMVY